MFTFRNIKIGFGGVNKCNSSKNLWFKRTLSDDLEDCLKNEIQGIPIWRYKMVIAIMGTVEQFSQSIYKMF